MGKVGALLHIDVTIKILMELAEDWFEEHDPLEHFNTFNTPTRK